MNQTPKVTNYHYVNEARFMLGPQICVLWGWWRDQGLEMTDNYQVLFLNMPTHNCMSSVQRMPPPETDYEPMDFILLNWSLNKTDKHYIISPDWSTCILSFEEYIRASSGLLSTYVGQVTVSNLIYSQMCDGWATRQPNDGNKSIQAH